MMCQLPVYGELAQLRCWARERGDVLLRSVSRCSGQRPEDGETAELISNTVRRAGLP
jgi:hypothetical protein